MLLLVQNGTVCVPVPAQPRPLPCRQWTASKVCKYRLDHADVLIVPPYAIAACDSIIEVLNMEPLGGTESPSSTSVHTLQLSGIVIGGGGKVLVRCRMTYSRGQGVTLELGVRAEKQEACDLVVAAVGG